MSLSSVFYQSAYANGVTSSWGDRWSPLDFSNLKLKTNDPHHDFHLGEEEKVHSYPRRAIPSGGIKTGLRVGMLIVVRAQKDEP